VGITGWVFVYMATLTAPDVRITNGLTSLQCAVLIGKFDELQQRQNAPGEWWCISPEGEQFRTAKEMGIRVPSRNRTK
jgi:hypothetical protein